MGLDEKKHLSGTSSPAMLEKAAVLFLGRKPESDDDLETLGIRLGKTIKKAPYSPYYLRYVLEGEQPMTKPLYRASMNLISEVLAEPAPETYEEVMVKIPNGNLVPEGTVVMAEARTCICGISFVPTIWNQINHTPACAKMRARLRSLKK